jgi:hypothetical protein
MMVVSVSVVSDCGRKAYWYLDKMLFVSRCEISWSFIRVSKILAMIGRIDMGR